MEKTAHTSPTWWSPLATTRTLPAAVDQPARSPGREHGKYRRVFPTLPTTIEKLDEHAKASGFTLARILRLDAAQVSHWRSFNPSAYPVKAGAKRVPHEYVRSIAARVGSPDGAILELLYAIEEEIHKLARYAHEAPIFRACWPEILTMLQELVAQDEMLPLLERAANCERYLVITRHVLADFEHTAFRDPGESPIRRETISLSLQYPAHIVAGRLMASPSLAAIMPFTGKSAQQIIVHGLLRQTKFERAPSLEETYSSLHAIHVLARYGGRDHHDDLRRRLLRRTPQDDPMTQLMLNSAQLLAPYGNTQGDDFAQKLLRDHTLCEASLAFDAMHYGDTCFSRADLIVPKSYDRTLYHVARRLRSVDVGSPYASVAAVKLARMFRLARRQPGASAIHPIGWIADTLTTFIQSYAGSRCIRDELVDAAYYSCFI